MTNWNKIQDSVHVLFPGITADKFARIIENSMCDDDNICHDCKIEEECLHEYFVCDKNGEYVRTENGDLVINHNFPGCEKMILNYLNKPVSD
jgi:hypothetical protein